MVASLFLSSVILLGFGKRRLALIPGCAWVLLAALVGGGVLPNVLLNALQVRDRLRDHPWPNGTSTIVVLGGGLERWPGNKGLTSTLFQISRVREAARLYFECRKVSSCRILASGGDPQKLGVSEASAMRDELVELGVNASDVVLEEKSNNTYQNAEFSSAILRREGASAPPVLVTSGVHLSRALLYFKGFAISAVGAPSDQVEARFSLIPLSMNFFLSDLAWHEFAGVVRFYVYERLGWNRRVTEPGAL